MKQMFGKSICAWVIVICLLMQLCTGVCATTTDAQASSRVVINGTVDNYNSSFDEGYIIVLEEGKTYSDFEAVATTADLEACVAHVGAVTVNSDGTYNTSFPMADVTLSQEFYFAYDGSVTLLDSSSVAIYESMIDFYVDSVSGADTNDGLSAAAAVKSITKAEELAADYLSNGVSCNIILKGTYNEIPVSVSPQNGAALTYMSAEGTQAVISNATVLKLADFELVTDANVLENLNEKAKNGLYQLDLNEYNLTEENIRGASGYESTMATLIMNDKPQTVSRWPNSGYYNANFTEITANSTYSFSCDRVAEWTGIDKAFVEGYFNPNRAWNRNYSTLASVDVEKNTATINAPGYLPEGAIGTTGKIAVHNILSEVDIPGEWYVDTDTMILYYYMPDGVSSDDVIELTTSEAPLVNASDKSNIHFENIHLKGSKDALIKFTNVNNSSVKNCTLDNAKLGVVLTGTDNVIEGNAIYNIKSYGVHLMTTGSVQTMEGTNNVVRNNYFYNCAYSNSHGSESVAAIRVGTTGHISSIYDTVEYNIVHGNPNGTAVFYRGIGDKIQYNEFYNLMHNAADLGVIYTGKSLIRYGNEINYNYIHDFGHTLSDSNSSSVAIYWDDWQSGQTAEGNIIIGGNGNNTRAFLTVGESNTAKNNIVVGTDKGVIFSARATQPDSGILSTFDELTDALSNKYKEISTNKQELAANNDVFVPDRNVKSGNLEVNVKNSASDSGVFADGENTNNYVLTTGASTESLKTTDTNVTAFKNSGLDSVFKDPDNHDWRLLNSFANTNTVLSGLPTESTFSMDEIGLQNGVWSKMAVDKSFDLVYPVSKTVSYSDKITLVWEQAISADKYFYEVATDNTFAESSIAASGYVTDKLAEVSGLKADTTYYWRVTAHNESKQIGGTWTSSTGTFTMSKYAIDNIVFYNSEGSVLTKASEFIDASTMDAIIVNGTDTDVVCDIIVVQYSGDGKVLKKILSFTKGVTGKANDSTKTVLSLSPCADTAPDDMICIFLWSNNTFEPLYKKTVADIGKE